MSDDPMNLADLPDHELERLFNEGLLSDDQVMQIAQERLSPDELAIIDGIAYGIAKLFNTPINQLAAEAGAYRASLPPGHPLAAQVEQKVSGLAPAQYNARMMSAHAGLDHFGADTIARYRNVAINAVMGTHHQSPSPVYGYLRLGQQQHIYLFPSIHDGHAWFDQRNQIPNGFDYVAVFDATNLSAPIAEDLGSDNPPIVGCDPTQIGHWFLPLALGLPLGAAGGYAYRGWREKNPGRILPRISGEAGPDVGSYPWASIHDLDGPRFVQHGPWINIVGADDDVARRRAWPRTKALIKSAINDARAFDAWIRSQGTPSSRAVVAYVWSLQPPWGNTPMSSYPSHEQALADMRNRIHEGGDVAVALFDKTSPHWPNPVNWHKSDDPAHEDVITAQIAKYAPGQPSVGTEPWQSIVGGGPWQSIVGGGPWSTIIGDAITDVRARAQSIAAAKPGRAIGVIHAADGLWHSFAFKSLDDADDWFGSVTQDKASFTYAAYFDKDAAGNAFVANEGIGGVRMPSAPGAPIRRGIATAD